MPRGIWEGRVHPGVDVPTRYEYFIEASNSSTGTVLESNRVEESVLSGFSRYEYVINTEPESDVSGTVSVLTNGINIIQAKANLGAPQYLHIKAIDNVGNESEVVHFELNDGIAPTLSATISPEEWTNGSVLISVVVDDSVTDLAYLILPDGNQVNASSASFSVFTNGIYGFQSVDTFGNIGSLLVQISNIDSIPPELVIMQNPESEWVNVDTEISIVGSDE